MTKEEAIKILERKIECMEDGAICCDFGIDKEVFRMAIEALSHGDKIIDEHYRKGYESGVRETEWIYHNIIKEIRERADRLKDSLFGDGLRWALEIIDKYKAERKG